MGCSIALKNGLNQLKNFDITGEFNGRDSGLSGLPPRSHQLFIRTIFP